jgi:hypothetical protein
MKDVTRPLRTVAAPACLIVLIFLGVSCSSPTYQSPSPGTLTVKLRTVSNNISFSPLNDFDLVVQSIQANRSDGTFLQIFQDTKTVKSTPSTYNTLDPSAEDSEMVLGSVYAPPGSYTGLVMSMNPGATVILNGYQVIPVYTLSTFDGFLSFPGSFSVNAGGTTTVILTINLDQTLNKGAEVFYFESDIFMSSVHYN